MSQSAEEGHERFISEPVEPNRDTFDTEHMAIGEPGIPKQFTWRKKKFDIAEVLLAWKSTGDCRSGSSEKYVRKHWYRIRTETDEIMTLYCNRNVSRYGQRSKGGWVLYSVLENLDSV